LQSIQSDVSYILANNNDIDWTYKKRLKLESMLLLLSRPVMCMDSLSIAGLTVHLQHQLLSCRNIQLNPLKNNNNLSKLKLLEVYFSQYTNYDIYSKLSNEPQPTSSKIKVCKKCFHYIRECNI